MFKAKVITVSDSSFAGLREDLSGKVIAEILSEAGYEVLPVTVVPDVKEIISAALLSAVAEGAELILTTGGTGLSVRDVTPEATLAVIQKQAPGIAEAIRADSMRYTPRAMLSRGVAGVADGSLIVNLPGSPKAVEEALNYVLPTLLHGLEILTGKAKDCGRR